MSTTPAQPANDAAVRASMRRVAKALQRNRHAVALCLKDSMATWEKYAPQLESMGVETFLEWETIPLADYLIGYLRDDDPNWRTLFIGERLKQLHWTDSMQEMMDRRERVFTADRTGLLALLQPHVSEEDLRRFDQRMTEIGTLVSSTARSNRRVKILFVGDCLYLDLNVFLAVPLLESGITLDCTYATSKNPVELRSTLRNLRDEKFDLVCYSPYSHEFNMLLAQTQYLRQVFSTPAALRRLAAEAHEQTVPTLRLICEQFDSNIIVHNTANIRRHDSSIKDIAKCVVTWRSRRTVAKAANALLVQELVHCNTIAAQPVVLLDETKLTAEFGELALGKKFYNSEPQHTAALALRLSAVYHDLVCAAEFLRSRKVLIADLDNTLWDGVIGEGSVRHDHKRQQMLKLLKQKGVLLAIASKNDPQNVHWTGGLLNENDFVAAQINWGPKSTSIKRIAEELNLKLKDFVFIDDRPDERELVSIEIPGIHCLDATSDSAWQMLAWWADLLPEQNEADRTQMYLERKLRQTHLDESSEKEDQQQRLAGLGLRLEIRPATTKDLPRAAELINRTNQFNTCGSRVSNQQVAAWHSSPHHHILVAEAADKFGAMGIISVMVLEEIEGTLQIPVWVLSCRVFGFGMETAMLHQARRIGKELGTETLRGLFVETPNNQPCRDVYSSNGFTWSSTAWELRESAIPADPAWLTVSIANTLAASTR